MSADTLLIVIYLIKYNINLESLSTHFHSPSTRGRCECTL